MPLALLIRSFVKEPGFQKLDALPIGKPNLPKGS